MYTQCPQCETLYQISANDLVAAHGQVRCSCCATTFNALRSLSEAPPAPATTEPVTVPADDLVPATRAPTDDAATVPPDVDDGWPANDTELMAETDGGPARVQTSDQPVPDTSPSDAARHADTEAPVDESPDADTTDPWADARHEPSVADIRDTDDSDEFLTADELARDATDLQHFLLQRPRRWKSLAWGLGAALMLGALGVQIVHHERNRLVRHSWFGPKLLSTYSRLGLALDPNYQPELYRFVRGPEVSLETRPGAGAELRVRATIENLAARAQPYPQIRITLSDRWGTPVASRSFTPDEYLQTQHDPDVLLAARQTTPVELLVVDPGADAFNYDLDICVPDVHKRLRCRRDAQE